MSHEVPDAIPFPPITDEREAEAMRIVLAGYEKGIAIAPEGPDVVYFRRQAMVIRTELAAWEAREDAP